MTANQRYAVKKFIYDRIVDPKDPKKQIGIRLYITVKNGLTWQEAKTERKNDRSLQIVRQS